MIAISVNDQIKRIPEHWGELPFTKIDELVYADDPLFVMSGLPMAVVELLDQDIQAKVAKALAAFQRLPDGKVDQFDVNERKFGEYLNASYALKAGDKLAFVRAWWPDTPDNCLEALPKFEAAARSWAAFHQYWSWLETGKADQDWIAAGGRRLEKYGIYGMAAQVGGRSLKDTVELVTYSVKEVYTFRAYWSEYDEVMNEAMKIKNGKGNLRQSGNRR